MLNTSVLCRYRRSLLQKVNTYYHVLLQEIQSFQSQMEFCRIFECTVDRYIHWLQRLIMIQYVRNDSENSAIITIHYVFGFCTQ